MSIGKLKTFFSELVICKLHKNYFYNFCQVKFKLKPKAIGDISIYWVSMEV